MMRWQPTTQGISIARATIEVWLVRPPRSVAMPRMRLRSMPAVCDGVSSCETMMTGSSSAESRDSFSPISLPSTRRSRSRTSLAFWRKTSLPIARNWSVIFLNASATATSAFTRSPEMRLRIGPSSAGSCSRPRWKPKIFAASRPSCASVRSRSTTRSAVAAASAPSSRASSIGMSLSAMSRCGTCVSASPSTKTRPMTIPGDTGIPFSVCMPFGACARSDIDESV
jgi:hypothetical protein